MKLFTALKRCLLKVNLSILARMAKSRASLLNELATVIEKNGENYIQFRLRPKNSKLYKQPILRTTLKNGEVAIVLQGLIETKDDFTLETVRLYKKIIPEAFIIISTWDTTEETLINEFRNEGCHIVINKSFKNSGIGNVNYQICTSLSGIKKAKELGALYTLKARSDIRLYRSNVFEYMKGLLSVFPVAKDNDFNLKGRIITQAGNWGQLYMPLWLQDFLYFGYTDDLLNLFTIDYNTSDISSPIKYFSSLGRTVTGFDLYENMVPEMFITKSFINKYKPGEISLEQSWKILKDLFIVVDQEQLGSFWCKYGIRNLSTFYCENEENRPYENAWRNISFEDFVNIYTNQYIYEDWMENEKSNYIVFKDKCKR